MYVSGNIDNVNLYHSTVKEVFFIKSEYCANRILRLISASGSIKDAIYVDNLLLVSAEMHPRHFLIVEMIVDHL